MINPKRLVEITRKWQKLAVIGRKRISMSRIDFRADWEACNKSTPNKGHFIIYTADGRRFAIPWYITTAPSFKRYLRCPRKSMDCHATVLSKCLNFHAVFMDYVVSLLQRKMPKDVEKALLMSIANGQCSTQSCLHQPHTNQSILVHAY